MGLDREGIYRTIKSLEPVVSGKAIYSIASDENSIIAASRDCVQWIGHGIFERSDYPDYSSYDGIRIV